MGQRERAGLQGREVIEEIAAEFTTEELQEFLEADQYPVEADPAFKEELREKLWKLVQRSLQESSEDSPPDRSAPPASRPRRA
jgi:hypothetical protein